MKVEVYCNETSNAIEYDNVINTYTKGNMYCIYLENDEGNEVVHKYPVSSIFRIVEDY